MTLYSRFATLCKARPKTMAATFVVFTTAAFIVNPAVWRDPVFAAWIAAVVLLPLPFEIAAMVRKERRRKTKQED